MSLCHASDELTQGACFELDQILKTTSANTIVTCDDIIHHQTWRDEDGYEQRQYRSPISAIRLYTRAAIGGLVTRPIALFNQAVLRTSYSCLESLRLDCLLQILQQDRDVRHCHRPLIKTLQRINPVLPEQGWPKEPTPLIKSNSTTLIRFGKGMLSSSLVQERQYASIQISLDAMTWFWIRLTASSFRF